MVFSSVEFLFLFLPVFLIFYIALPALRNIILLAFSLLFYFVGEGYFLAVMLASIAINYVSGLFVAPGVKGRGPALAIGLTLNVVMLVYYKYIGFLAQDVFQLPANDWTTDVHLPIGISFFTFQGMSYLIDVYRGNARKEMSPFRLAAYIAMFPQLIAGPIVRFSTVANDLRRRVIRLKHVYYGLLFFAVGLAEKVILADTMAKVADAIYGRAPDELQASTAFLGGLTYSFQIFFDFSGYSAMAIGLGLILGFKFPRNFNFPYISQSITEFWRRWHLSLSTWFRDYCYIPLGGNRLGPSKTYRNLFLIFLLTGVWHGASWNFIVWGLWHGFFIIIERFGFSKVLEKMWIGLRVSYTLIIAYIGWIFFRAEDLTHGLQMLARHFAFGEGGASVWEFLDNETLIVLGMSFVLSTPVVLWASRGFIAPPAYGAWMKRNPMWKYGLGVALAAILIIVSSVKILAGTYSPFIYFRF
ncbi:MBOAT family O-acyltransferase [Ponticaulis sp.]|uniref:MBOAT family O-acyltransferase n=1 Tax=Ponticaulis sp. TaxID=2020902 RepID=UPI002603A6D5|nr:MBOAT family O-acyltransferase [Ponticaulis sp.]MDF1680423.1 hypothetical protein [Ponticaulis sp.]